VLRADPKTGTMLVSHTEVRGLMPAMTMEFHALPGEMDKVRPGSRVRFELARSRAGRSWEARRIRVFDGLRELEVEAPRERLATGSPAPDFALTDEQGRVVRLSDFAGQVVLVNFIYTRCPLPEVCPRLTASFASLQRRYGERLGRGLVMLSITLDPTYDTPEVLARYAKSSGARPDGWRFLTGSQDEIGRVARTFGLVHWAEEGVIVHSSSTAVVDRDGKFAALVEGSSFRFEHLSELVRLELVRERPN
jgi:protein SCO1/2